VTFLVILTVIPAHLCDEPPLATRRREKQCFGEGMSLVAEELGVG